LFRYYLSNEGVGPALDVEHGVMLTNVERTIDELKRRYGSVASGERLPPISGARAPYFELVAKAPGDPVYWARFNNVFGERFETRTYSDPSHPVEFIPLSR
jgi:hypothetical protein